MKRLGHTEYGGVIVEMSHEEWRLLAHLSNVESGLSEWEIMARGGEQMASSEFDLADTYSKIIAYSQNKAILNEFREHIDRMERAYDGGRFKRPKVDKGKIGSKR